MRIFSSHDYKRQMFFPVVIFLCLSVLCPAGPCYGAYPLTPEAQQMYEKYNQAVVQVRVISRSSGEKSSLGSGFFFTKDGLIATNYHVVSDAVNYGTHYFVEGIFSDGQRSNLEVLNIDPVHDMAILKAPNPGARHLSLGDSHLSKGVKIFSFGNPYDFGLIIIEGLFNGLMERARYRKILFSGSLNPGMSGGPALREDGRVLGVNVSTAGNEISFFVPVEYLKLLHQEIVRNGGKTVGPHWRNVIRKRLVLDQQDFLKGILKTEQWNKRQIGIAQVPAEIAEQFRCWGQTGDNKRKWVADNYLKCSTEDDVFISRTMRTGAVYFDYEWYESRGNDPLRFYNLYEQYASNRDFVFQNAEERDAGNFECQQEFVAIDRHLCKLELCVRRYKMYQGLFDLSVQLALADRMTRGLVINIAAQGITEMQGKQFIRRFLNEIRWQE